MSFEQRNCYETDTIEIVYMFKIEISKNKVFHSQISTSVFIQFHCVGVHGAMMDQALLIWEWLAKQIHKIFERVLKHKTPKETKVMTLENCNPQFSFYWPRMLWNMYVFHKRNVSHSNNNILQKTQKIWKNSWWHNVYFRFCMVMS